jgi:hypothetical protein
LLVLPVALVDKIDLMLHNGFSGGATSLLDKLLPGGRVVCLDGASRGQKWIFGFLDLHVFSDIFDNIQKSTNIGASNKV